MTIQLTAYNWVPPFAQGYVRDLRVRWALEEAGLPYRTILLDPRDKPADYRAWQPFNQVPAYRDDEVEMFESGAIVLHLAEKSEALAPRDPKGWARATTWVVAALNSIEPVVMELAQITLFHKGEAWTEERRPQVEAFLHQRLKGLADCLGDKDWLEGRFTAGDLIMVTVVRELKSSGLIEAYPNLKAYMARGEARPAFVRAMGAQMQAFREPQPA